MNTKNINRVVTLSDLRRTLPDALFNNRVAILPGNHDLSSRPLVIFPSSGHPNLPALSGGVVILIQYYLQLVPPRWRAKGLAFLVDLQRWKIEQILPFIEIVESFQNQNKDVGLVLYAVCPKVKACARRLQKLTGLRVSKHNPKSPRFQTIIVRDNHELNNYIEQSSLTNEFEGEWPYNHASWMQFRMIVEELELDVKTLLKKIPSAVDSMNVLRECALPSSEPQLQALVDQIGVEYNDVTKQLDLESVIDDCHVTSMRLTHPEDFAVYCDLAHTQLLLDVTRQVDRYSIELLENRSHLKALWQKAEQRVLVGYQLNAHRTKADKLIAWIQNVGLPKVRKIPPTAECRETAEKHLKLFESNVYNEANDILREADGTALDEQALRDEGGTALQDFVSVTKQLEGSAHKFRAQVDKTQSLLVNVHNFYIYTAKKKKVPTATLR